MCGGGSRWSAHLTYVSDGSAAAGATFAAARVGGATTPPTPTCVTSSTWEHITGDRAVYWFGVAYARGSLDRLGRASRDVVVSLAQTGPTTWRLVASC